MIAVAEVTKTAAIVKLSLSEGSGANQVHTRYRTTTPEGPWLGQDTQSVIGGIAGAQLTGLTPGTEYEIQASPDQAFPDTDTASMVFTTATPDPYVSGVTATNVTSAEATIDISIAYPCPKSNTVYIRYRTDDQQPWSDPPIEVVADSGSTSYTLSQLSPGTGYTVEASLGRNFVAAETEEAIFTTLVPRVSSVIVESLETSEASVKVTIANSGPDTNTIHLRYGTSGSAPATWTTLPPRSLQKDVTTYALSGLTPGTNYTVEASLDGSFEAGVESATFITTKLPTIGPVTMTDVTDTTAKAIVTILNSGQGRVTVYMRYRGIADRNWGSSQDKTSMSGTTVFILSDLVPSTDYRLEVSLDSVFASPQATTFRTQSSTLRPWSAEPRVSGVYVNDATTSSATIVAAITGPEGPITVRLRYRAPGSTTWEATRTSTSFGANASFNLGGLTADTEYEVEAAVDPAFPFRDTVYSVFNTAVVRVSNIKFEDVADTRATVVARLDDPQGQTTIYLRYRIFGTWLWVGPQYRTTSSHTVRLFLEDLEPDTEYEAEASTSQDFMGGNAAYATFVTEPAPRVSDVQVEVSTNTGATLTALIDNPRGNVRAYLRLRVEGTGSWSKPKNRTTSTARVSFSVSDLIPETMYEAEASLDREFPTDTTVQAFFMTKPNPKLSSMTVDDVSDKGGAVAVTLVGPQPKTTVFLRYRARGDLVWNGPQTRTTSLDTARFALSNLTPATEYELEASLFLDFRALISSTFVTVPKRPVPYSITGGPITQTTATIVVHIDNPRDSVTVHLRIRVWGSNSWRNPESLRTSEPTVPFDLTRLAGGTTYEIETSTESGFPSSTTVSAIFTTAPAARVSRASVGGVTGANATVTITIGNSDGSLRTVHLRYRKVSDDIWIVTETETRTERVETEISGLTPATDYIVETSLAPDFPHETTQSVAFGTLAPEPSDLPAPIAAPPIAAVYPDALEFTMIEDDVNPGEVTLNIWNVRATSDLEFVIVEDIPWISVDRQSGTSTDPQDVVRLVVKEEATGMKAGEHIGAIEVTGNAENLPLSIPVTLTVTKPVPSPTPTSTPTPAPTSIPTSTPIPATIASVAPTPTYTALSTSTPNPTTAVAPLPSAAPSPTLVSPAEVTPNQTPPTKIDGGQRSSTIVILAIALSTAALAFSTGLFVFLRRARS